MKPVDIMQECTQLFAREDTLAYFDFTFGQPALEGLCRIARPKQDAGGSEYIALVFLIDTPAQPEREQAIGALRQLGAGVLETVLPEIASAISVPTRSAAQQIYIKQFDLMLKGPFRPSQEFIAQRLYPALKSALNLQTGELGWWDGAKKEKDPLPAAAPEGKPKSLIARLREKLPGR